MLGSSVDQNKIKGSLLKRSLISKLLIIQPKLLQNHNNKESQWNQCSFVTPIKSLAHLLFQAHQLQIFLLTQIIYFFQNLFECLPIKDIQILFQTLDQYIKNVQISETAVNALLKIGNLILKKTSKLQDSYFRGKVHLFLTKILNIFHLSGQNIKGSLNLSHLIKTDQLSEDSDDKGIDYSFYKSFWTLQKYFQDPSLIMKKQKSKQSKLIAICGLLQQICEIFRNQSIKDQNYTNLTFNTYFTGKALLNLQVSIILQAKRLTFPKSLDSASNIFHLESNQKPQIFNKLSLTKINSIQLKLKDNLYHLCEMGEMDFLAKSLEKIHQNQLKWQDFKDAWKQKTQLINTTDQAQLKKKFQQVANQPLINYQPRYYQYNKIISQIRYRMKLQHTQLMQQFLSVNKPQLPTLKQNSIEPNFQYFYDLGIRGMQELQATSNVQGTFENKQQYALFEWKAMRCLSGQCIRQSGVLQQKNSKDYKVLSLIRKLQNLNEQNGDSKIKNT